MISNIRIKALLWLWVTILSYNLCLCKVQDGDPVVDTPRGRIRGVLREHEDGQDTLNFLGIPYVQPPIGELRFRPPVPYPSWTGTLNATDYSPSCLQLEFTTRPIVPEWLVERVFEKFTMSEDCLTLNVFAPSVPAPREDKLPVMFWIHGGAFMGGSSSLLLHEGDWLAQTGECIVVSINYRLGTLGFLTTNDDNASPSNGLRDMIEALRWVQENIASFGGDPDRVTVFGESAGGSAVAYLSVSPLARGLFKRGISQSVWHHDTLSATPPQSQEIFIQILAASFNCSTDNSTVLMDCLRMVEVERFLDVVLLFEPTYGNDVLPKSIDELYADGSFNEGVELIFGSVPLEGSVVLTSQKEKYDEGMTADDVDEYVNTVVALAKFPNKELLEIALRAFYFPEQGDAFYRLDRVIKMMTDFMFESPKGMLLDRLAEYDIPVYEYYLQPRASFLEQYVYEGGAHHMDDVYFTMGATLSGGIVSANATTEEKEMTRSLINAWLSFAKDGVPRYLDSSGQEREWPNYQSEKKTYLEFNLRMTEENEREDLHAEEKEFWNSYLPSIGGF